MAVVWIFVGLVIAGVGLIPLVRLLLRRAEQRSRAAERVARESARLAELGSMTGGLAHEIKNPLSTIGLNAQLLAEELREAEMPEDHRQRLLKRLDALAREAERLKGILTDFLQFAGRMKLDPEPHDLGALVEELSDFFHPQCDQAGVTLRTSVPAEPVTVRVDERLFKQALLNLLMNAVQAMSGPDGGGRERAGRRSELLLSVSADPSEARVGVIDTGPGIGPERLEQIFHPYVSHRSSGTGLGLPTARRIAEEHGGRLSVHSDLGQGSAFVIHLPRE